MHNTDFCGYPRCKHESDYVYLTVGICDSHWKKIADFSPEKIRRILKIKLPKEGGVEKGA